MRKKFFAVICLVSVACLLATSISFAAGKEGAGTKIKNFWRRLFNYPARVTEESAAVVTETGKKSTKVVTEEVKRVGEVTSGDIAKTKELVTEPITGTAEMAVKTVEETVKIPVEAAKEEKTPAEK